MIMQPHTSYLVCGTPRSGSSLLCEALVNTGIAGQPEEYFQPSNEVLWRERWGTSTYAEYLERTIEHCTSPNGVFGVKMMWGYFDHFLRNVRQMPDYKEQELSDCKLLQALFPNLRYIWIKRRDTVRQAVSHTKAMQTNLWAVRAENATLPARTPEFSFMQIDYMVQEISAHDAAWQRFFTENGIQPLVIIYEDSVANYEETVRKALQHLDIPGTELVTCSPVTMKKQADAQSEQWVQRYLQLKQQARRYRIVSYVNKYLLSFLLSTKAGSFIMKKRG
jgi:trehalose 2-sulfotransferase